jgi:hypothetical protein
MGIIHTNEKRKNPFYVVIELVNLVTDFELSLFSSCHHPLSTQIDNLLEIQSTPTTHYYLFFFYLIGVIMISVRVFITSMLNGLILLSYTAAGLQNHASRRQFLFTSSSSLVGGITLSNPHITNAAVDSPSLNFETSRSGIQWADAKVGNGPVPKVGTYVSIDYVLST